MNNCSGFLLLSSSPKFRRFSRKRDFFAQQNFKIADVYREIHHYNQEAAWKRIFIRVFHVEFNYIRWNDEYPSLLIMTEMKTRTVKVVFVYPELDCSCVSVRNHKTSSLNIKQGVWFDWRKKDINYQVRSAFSHFFYAFHE